MAEVAVLGGGAWGTALAQMLASDGRDVLLWAREPEVVEDINANHRNTPFLPSADFEVPSFWMRLPHPLAFINSG